MSTHSPRIVFAGTPEFAATALTALLQHNYQVCAVYCQPDKASGRGQQIRPGPVKSVACSHGIPVLQPEHWRDSTTLTQLASYNADLMIVAAYGLMLPPTVLNTPRYGCINIHASLLPRWRGAAPIQRSLLAGDTETGVGIMQMEPSLDTGPLIHERRCPILEDDTSSSLHAKLATVGATALLEALQTFPHWNPKPQAAEGVVYAQKIRREESPISWTSTALEIDRQIRALHPWPVATSTLNAEVLRIHKARIIPTEPSIPAPPGGLWHISRQGWCVATGAGHILLEQLQLPGGKILTTHELGNSRPWIQPGIQLGEKP